MILVQWNICRMSIFHHFCCCLTCEDGLPLHKYPWSLSIPCLFNASLFLFNGHLIFTVFTWLWNLSCHLSLACGIVQEWDKKTCAFMSKKITVDYKSTKVTKVCGEMAIDCNKLKYICNAKNVSFSNQLIWSVLYCTT